MDKKIAVITGANRGLGLKVSEELAKKNFLVYMLGRKAEDIENSAKKLQEQKLSVIPMTADVANTESIHNFTEKLKKEISCVDLLVNNAGVYLEAEFNLENVPLGKVSDTFNINTMGALRMFQALAPFLKKSKAPRIVNVSSGMGCISDVGGGFIGYRMSKVAMNMLTRVMTTEWAHVPNFKVNSVCPGWVRTDMGGSSASRSIEEGASSILAACLLDADGPTDAFLRDGKVIDW